MNMKRQTLEEQLPVRADQPPPGPTRLVPAGASPWRATGQEPPVFLDERGYRTHVIQGLGLLGGLASAGALALLVVAVLAFTHISRWPLSSHHMFAGASVHHRSQRGPAIGYHGPPESSVRLEAFAKSERPKLAGARQTPRARRSRV